MKADLLALAAIAMWGLLAPLSVRLAHIPPFLLTAIGLLIGGMMALPWALANPQRWRVPLPTLLVGIYGLFGFHFLLFMGLRHAPAVQANLINYLWPLGIVVMSPLFLPGTVLRMRHRVAALLGLAGAMIAITGKSTQSFNDLHVYPGYLLALASAFVWASYSLMTRRLPRFPTTAVGGFATLSGLLSLACHVAFEPTTALHAQDLWLLILLGVGPLGAAFYLWDAALKTGDPRRIGVLAFCTPIVSTVLLLLDTGQPAHWSIVLATVMVVGGAWVGRA